MRLTDKAIRDAAPFVRPFLTDAIRAKGCLDNEDMRAGVKAARKAGEPIPNLTSDRSMKILEEAVVEL